MNSTAPAEPRRGLLSTILRALPAVLVMAVLVAVAVWGHSRGWSFTAVTPVTPPKPSLVTLRESATGTELIFDSALAADAAGIEAAEVVVQPVTESLTASAMIRFDPAAVARVSARVDGTLVQVRKAIGDTVAVGEIVAVIDSASVTQAKGEFQQALLALRQARRVLERLQTAGVAVASQQLREAEADLREAGVSLSSREQALHNLGFALKKADYDDKPFEQFAVQLRNLGLDTVSESSSQLPVKSPLAGTVLAMDGVRGESVTLGKVVCTIVDPRRVLLTVSIPEADAMRIRCGAVVQFRPDGAKADFTGGVTTIALAAETASRTVAVQAELANDDGVLRAGLPGRAKIILAVQPDAITVPKDAVVKLNGNAVVFVRNPDYFKTGVAKSYRVQAVDTGISDGTIVEIKTGLSKGSVIAAKGAGGLADEIQRQRSRGANYE